MSSRRDAFTLVELLLVLVILGAVSLITLPNISQSYKNFMLQKEIEEVVYLMRLAQTKAIVNSENYYLMIDSETQSFWLAKQAADTLEAGEAAEEYVRLTSSEAKEYQLPGSFELSSEIKKVQFFPNGRIEKALIDICRENECYTITTKEHRGYVQVVKSQEE